MARIVVVDDNGLIRQLVSGILRSHGHTVIEAADGEEGFKTALREVPDLIVTDFYMPRMTGSEMIIALGHSDKCVADIPIIGLAGSLHAEKHLVDAGVFSYLPKPLNEKTLVAEVDKALSSRPVTLRTSP
jgi:CheY-like chemotaxis protein